MWRYALQYTNAIFKTGPRASNVVLAGDLVPDGSVLVTPDVGYTYTTAKTWMGSTKSSTGPHPARMLGIAVLDLCKLL